jgi:hypothetical protein
VKDDIKNTIEKVSAQIQRNIYWRREMNVGHSFIIQLILVEMSLDDVININEY